MACQENWSMDKLLKKVYSLHKQSMNDASAEVTKYKDALQRSEERIKELEMQNDHLRIENRRLSTLEDTKQTSSGSCCEVIRQSLQMVITSYKELLENKDHRIKELEEQLAKYKRRLTASSADSLNWTMTEETSNNRMPRFGVDHSPDSTSKSTPVGKTDSTNRQNLGSQATSATEANTVDKGEVKSPEEGKKRLQRRTKRSRYSEEVSPETKRPRLKAGGKENGNQNRKVFVEDTCHSENIRKLDRNNVGMLPKRESGLEETVLIVPETMAVDCDHSDEELGDEDIGICQNAGHKLSRIEEMGETLEHDGDNFESNSRNENATNGRRKVDETNLKEANNDYVEVGRSSCKSAGVISQRDRGNKTDRSRLKSILTSPETDGHNSENDSLYEAISDIGANLVDDSDGEEETLPSQRKMSSPNEKLLSKHKAGSIQDELQSQRKTEGVNEKLVSPRKSTSPNQKLGYQSSSSHPLGGRCRNMDEVNELFETPAGKNNQMAKKLDEDAGGNKKRLFKNSTKHRLCQKDVILRRSPRKRKDINEAKVIHSNESNTKRNLGQIARNSSSGESDENDLTIAPEPCESLSSTGNQSMDLYHIVPVKNGQPVTSKQFDVKIKKNKYGGKSVNNVRSVKNSNKEIKTSETCLGNLDEDKSGSKLPEVVTISSPSVSSLSDPESPLLLKDNKKLSMKDTKVKGANVVDNDINHTDRNKVNRSRSNQTNSRRNVTTKQQQDDDDDLKADSPRSKSLRQTTLTQRFFSPDGKQGKGIKCDENAKKSKKGLKLGNDTASLEDEIVVINEESTFKKPANPTGRQNLTLRRNGRQHEQQQENGHQPLHDISSKHLNGSSTSLNGSLDPAAELTFLCGEPGTEENQPIKSLPSLDTDFCGEDLMTGSESLPKTSTLAIEECEDIPSSYRFMPKKKAKESANKENLHVSMDDSFDRPPKIQEEIIPQISVVRKKDERQKLQGYGCKQCEEYYKSAGRNEDEVKHHMNQCSRHRAQFLPPDTPPHFWSVGFIDTQECVDRGYIKVDDKQGKEDGPTHRRRRKLNKYFRSKTEGTLDNDSDEDLVYE